MMKTFSIFLALMVLAAGTGRARADALTDRLAKLSTNWVKQFSVPLDHWRFHQPDDPGGEDPKLNDSGWQEVSPGFSWHGENTKVWFRSTVVIPSTVAGRSVEGLPVRLELGVDDDGELYLNGQLKEAFHWDEGRYTLMQRARAGQTFPVAVRGINGPGDGTLHFARLYFDVLPEFDRYLDAAQFLEKFAPNLAADRRAEVEKDLRASEAEIHFTDVNPENLESVRGELAKALAALAPAARISREYDVYYIGHAHIDMNWEWTWPETIDTCRRTWNSAMNLMDEFPDFHFVQSQPGAYVPIEQQYPDEFARMQSMVARGQWEPVGGLWVESDTDLPSGEGLARSFLYGQRYFKAKFGRYAVTGWLPDSFGHCWQLPQLMQECGIRYFYHMRCGNGMELTWWESPDGSRVLKANTDNYDEGVDIGELARPAVNEQRLGLRQAVVVYGVGDHGGGPTREHILRIKSFQDNPDLPKVHLVSAEQFFDQLSHRPGAADLPVVDTDLQYTLVGCYTTHGDAKKALRSGENNLYSAEVLSTLAALMGEDYPVHEFEKAWKPLAFAQFHDIACGSAIHSTYAWMQEQLAPGVKFEAEQTEHCLSYLTENIDVQGHGSQAIAVWNTLSFPRTDVVKAAVTGAGEFHSVVDERGRRFPAQPASDGKLVFVARDVPAFGHAVYYPDIQSCPADGVSLNDAGDGYEVKTPAYRLRINKATGAISALYSQAAKWETFGSASDANEFEVLGDSGNAWELVYTGADTVMTANGAAVSIVDDGPVLACIRVVHKLGKSSFTQDICAYGALPRVDIPTAVNWHEVHSTVKVRLPVNVTNMAVEAQMPYGSIARLTNGQECPGQKWMDASQPVSQPISGGTPLDISVLLNGRCYQDFDGVGNAFPQSLLPGAGVHALGPNQVPFNWAGGQSDHPDYLLCEGQKLALPAGVNGDALYLLAACINGGRQLEIHFQMADGTVQTRLFQLNDWIVSAFGDNQPGWTCAYRILADGQHQPAAPNLWIVPIRLPKGAVGVEFPQDKQARIFAATIGPRPAKSSAYGLSILNNCKYGFDVVSNVFRLSVLRSTTDPDPDADQGVQLFTYSLYPHAGSWQEAHTDEQALSLNIPLLTRVSGPHSAAGGRVPGLSVQNIGGRGDLIVTGLKHCEDGDGYILRFYEADGMDTEAQINFDRPMRVEETDLLERTVTKHALAVQGNSVKLPVGHNQVVSLRVTPGS